jgi:hypothetical protein
MVMTANLFLGLRVHLVVKQGAKGRSQKDLMVERNVN